MNMIIRQIPKTISVRRYAVPKYFWLGVERPWLLFFYGRILCRFIPHAAASISVVGQQRQALEDGRIHRLWKQNNGG